ncbi:MAG: DUF2178 domain-containing protein [Parcubacteria group bacterium]|nr:DUF2178 domain-containing protein [Parcubacteria group bacterium]
MKKDKFRLIAIAVLTATVLASIILYAFKSKEWNTGNLLSIGIPLLIIVFMAFLILKRYKDVKQGMPMEDEMSKTIKTKAAAMSFYVTLYWLLAISWFEDFFARIAGLEQLTVSQTVGGGIVGMAVLFFAFWIYYSRKGKLV